MKSTEVQIGCQIQCLDRIPDPNAPVIKPPLGRRLKLSFTRRLDPRVRRAILGQVDRLYSRFSRLTGESAKSAAPVTQTAITGLKAGDLVRVRSKEEIEATLDLWGQLKGCGFTEEMEPYCGTTQRVLKPVQRFLDERDHRLKRTRGLILLEGAHCQGTEKFGRCDRNCFYFWREEWLEKIQDPVELKETETRTTASIPPVADSQSGDLKTGHLVRVRSREEIEATLDDGGMSRGCLFMPEMWAYCDTYQQVLRPLEIFLDERDYRSKRCTGVFLLKGLICQGSAYPEGCDHACFYFWREEWLERID